MKFHRQEIAFALTLLPFLAAAQSPSPNALPDLPAPPAAAASARIAPASAVPNRVLPPRPRSANETAVEAAAPGDLKPERGVLAPQLSIPFGKKAPPPTPNEERLVERGGAASAGGVDDAAARCDAQIVAKLRDDCRAKLAAAQKSP